MKKIHTYIESQDIGETVLCDVCNDDFGPDNNESGGFFFSSYAYCPRCARESLERIKSYGEEKYITSWCPEGKSFRQWVLEDLRKGDNTINVITKQLE